MKLAPALPPPDGSFESGAGGYKCFSSQREPQSTTNVIVSYPKLTQPTSHLPDIGSQRLVQNRHRRPHPQHHGAELPDNSSAHLRPLDLRHQLPR